MLKPYPSLSPIFSLSHHIYRRGRVEFYSRFIFHSPGIIAECRWSGCLLDEKKHQVRDVDIPGICSKNIHFICGNKPQSGAVWRIEQVKLL